MSSSQVKLYTSTIKPYISTAGRAKIKITACGESYYSLTAFRMITYSETMLSSSIFPKEGNVLSTSMKNSISYSSLAEECFENKVMTVSTTIGLGFDSW